MHRVIQAVMEAEADAQRTVASVQTQATQVLESARQRATHLSAGLRAESIRDADALVAAAVAQALEEKEARLGAARSRITEAFQVDHLKRKGLVDAAVRCVTAPFQL
jgi:vacuolar-type H+-ATPase subunit H